jgi:transcriptional antiterminator RfaH
MQTNIGWYLVRTRSGKEPWVYEQLCSILPEAFLPLLEARIMRWGRPVWSVVPLFPCYVFARFNLQERYFDIKYLAGVQGIVSAGRDPLVVPLGVVEEIKHRAVDGIVKIEQKRLDSGDCVLVVEGPFRGFEAIFDRYLSGAERVALLLKTVEANGIRVVLPSSSIAKRS